jgi:hypothetical protein
MSMAVPGQISGLDLVVHRATTDPVFRLHLLQDARQAIARAFGLELPARFRLKFVEKDPDADLMIVLPDLVEAMGPRTDADDAPDFCAGATGGAVLEWLDLALATIEERE